MTSNWILTAAHCVTNFNTGAVLNPNEITIAAGITQREDLISGQYRNVAQIIRHPNYNSTTLENDVALIQLDVNFNFNTNVGPILLTDSETYASVGTMARVTGWGNIIGQQGQIILSNQLQTLELPIISRSLANNINTSNNTVTSTMVPLYQVGAGASQGDSGGPASIVKDNSRYLIGCSSWGEFPKDQKPTIYTDLYDFRNWISNIVPLPNLIGNNIICSTPNTTFTLNNENATSWQVSSNLQILNSSDTTITVKPNVSYTTTGWIKAIFSTGIFITKNINLNNPVININDISLMDENYNSINGSGTYDDPFIICSNKSYILGGNSQLDMSDMNNITLPSGWSGYSYGAIQIFFTTGDFSGSQDNINCISVKRNN